jgi:hypothetical protein
MGSYWSHSCLLKNLEGRKATIIAAPYSALVFECLDVAASFCRINLDEA